MDIRVATKEEWLRERRALLRDEKALMRYKDHLAERRRALPWVLVDKDYEFSTSVGTQSLADLFGSKNQLIVYHFMYGPEAQAPCTGCSQVADTFNFTIPHIETRDATLVAVSRTELANIEATQAKMEWRFRWVSSLNSDFNFDYEASYREPGHSKKHWNFAEVEMECGENHGISVFAKHEGRIYHTYSCYARSAELVMVHLQYLDLLPKGRQDDEGILDTLRV